MEVTFPFCLQSSDKGLPTFCKGSNSLTELCLCEGSTILSFFLSKFKKKSTWSFFLGLICKLINLRGVLGDLIHLLGVDLEGPLMYLIKWWRRLSVFFLFFRKQLEILFKGKDYLGLNGVEKDASQKKESKGNLHIIFILWIILINSSDIFF